MFIDTHLHLDSEKYANYLEVVQRAKLVGVNKLITIGTSVSEFEVINKIILEQDKIKKFIAKGRKKGTKKRALLKGGKTMKKR